MRARAALILSGLPSVLALSQPLSAAELPDAVIRVNRGAGAESCPPEADLLRAVASQARVPPRERGPSKPQVDVGLERYGESYFATVRVNGGAGGVRTLESQGATCDALRDAVVLALLVLLERDGEAPTTAPPPILPPAPEKQGPSLFLSAGGAVTFGEPKSVFPAVVGGAGVLLGPWEAGAGVRWSPPRRIDVAPGAIDVQAWGFDVRLCYALAAHAGARLNACGLGSVFLLRGTGRGFDEEQVQVRPWWRAGAGLSGSVPLTQRLALAAFANGYATLHTEAFSVSGLDSRYVTSAITGHAGVELRVTLF